MALQLDEQQALDVLRSFPQNSLISHFYSGNSNLADAMESVFGTSFEYRDFANLRIGQIVKMAEVEMTARVMGTNSVLESQGAAGVQDSRGTFDASTLTITLFESADESTFIHEAGHFYLEVLSDLAGHPGAAQSLSQDMDTVLEWLGVPGGAGSWKKLSMEAKRPFHEKFAQGIEAYFMTGVAPKRELQGMFSRFAKFLAGVYQSVKGLEVSLTPQVTSVFDRLVAGSPVGLRAEVDVIEARLVAKLQAMDRFPADVNKGYAGMVANFYGAVADASGFGVLKLASKFPLQIRGDVHGLVPGGIEKVGVDSAAFKAWFGDSKAVDSQGQPLRVYHGTDAVDVDAFYGRESVGWFAEKPEFASQYAIECRSGADENGDESRPNVLPVFLSIKNPLILSFDMNDNAIAAKDVFESFGLDFRNYNSADKAYELINNSDFLGAVEKAGFDGVSVAERGARTWCPVRESQVKSVFNRGSWDRADKAILHQAPLDVAVVSEGRFSGLVVDVSRGGVVTQKVNRNGTTVQHAVSALSQPVVKGAVVDIVYADGVGVVSGAAVSKGVGR